MGPVWRWYSRTQGLPIFTPAPPAPVPQPRGRGTRQTRSHCRRARSDPNTSQLRESSSKRQVMPSARERMRPWLVRQINSNAVSGLSWINKEKSMFSIPWKHGARHGWTMDEDATLFKKWAVHTGKYKEGQKCDPKTWKANFRCALHSLPDVEEVTDRSVHKGQCAARVYRMLPTPCRRPRGNNSLRKMNVKQRKTTKIKWKRKIEESDPDYEPSHREVAPAEESAVPSELNDLKMVDESEVPEVSLMVEVGTYSFEVSPEHRPDYDYNGITITISQPLEKDALRTGFADNEQHTSPRSQWSEESSGEEINRLYTSLAPSLLTPAELWSESPPQTLLAL
ncbi:uncharacterized protein [Eucyclogobius newberryi]|uniref:uncharacterized protein n=1 Tax=Eucyclogobius newberryi TaxID=166745 RepID=UPI003B5C05C6